MTTAIDLFSGAGGLSLGAAAGLPGLEVLAAVEHEPRAAASFAANHPDAEVFCGDIARWSPAGLGGVDLVLGGPPCQGFSNMGRREAADERNELWRHYVRAVLDLRPRAFVMENVPQMLSSGQFQDLVGHPELGRLWDVRAQVLDAADYGAATHRRRAIVIGVRRDLPHPGHPDPTHGPGLEPFVTVRDVIGSLGEPGDLPQGRRRRQGRLDFDGPYRLDELHVHRRVGALSRQRYAAIPAGGNRFDLADTLLSKNLLGYSTGGRDILGRMHWDRPCVTLRTEFTKPEKGRYLHPVAARGITPAEGALLMGFSPQTLFVGPTSQIVRQIGNAVPIRLGAAIAAHLAPILS